MYVQSDFAPRAIWKMERINQVLGYMYVASLVVGEIRSPNFGAVPIDHYVNCSENNLNGM
jgi:hypothetical protein